MIATNMSLRYMMRLFKKQVFSCNRAYSKFTNNITPVPLRSQKPKSSATEVLGFVDVMQVQAIGGKGGDGCVSFLSVKYNEFAGPDGGDGGSGGHVVLEACPQVTGLKNLSKIIRAENGIGGSNCDCHGRNAVHTILKVPLGTIVKDVNGRIVGDLSEEGSLFVLAKGGAGGHGNHYFVSSTNQRPSVAECGAKGEICSYTIELKSMANFGLLGFPNAGKSTLLQAITRARPKVAPYPFTTKQPFLGVVKYSDYEQISVADLPGIIEGSHKNRGLGIQFLRHVERCAALVLIADVTLEPWAHIKKLRYELENFSKELSTRPQIILANKIDLPEADENLKKLQSHFSEDEIIPVSAKQGTNLTHFLKRLRHIYDESQIERDKVKQ